MTLNRREFLKWMSAGAGLAALPGCETTGGEGGAGRARVVVIGGGYGGATAAKYVKTWAPDIDVTLVERNDRFISCPLSNLVLAGNATMQDLTFGYEGLRARGVRLVRDDAVSIDPQTRDIIQNIYVRKVERKDGELYNVEFATIPNVKDPVKAAKAN